MSDTINSLIHFITGFVFREDIAVNLLSNIFYSIMGMFFLVLWRIMSINRKSSIPLNVIMLCFYNKARKLINHKNRYVIDGFYYAVYDSSLSEKNKRRTGKFEPPAHTTKVAECIYIHTKKDLFNITGIVIKRVKRKDNILVETEDFGEINGIRLVGRFSYTKNVFCGYWLDPFDPMEVAGTFMLRWENNNMGVHPSRQKFYLRGEWQGFEKDTKRPQRAGGYWNYERVAHGFDDFIKWKDNFKQIKSAQSDDQKFIDFI